MKKVITYGSFDLFHEGHYNLLKRAKALGNYLIVGVTTEYYDAGRGKLNVVDSLIERIENVKKTGFVDEIIIEDHEGQKLEDIQKYNIDIFAIGSDWAGIFDYLKEFCEVVYLERTPDVSSTILRKNKFSIVRIGIVGTGRISPRFFAEAKYVSGLTVSSVYNPHKNSAEKFGKLYGADSYSNNFNEFLDAVDAIYIASPHETHYEYTKAALEKEKHVLCEKPLVFHKSQAEELYLIAAEKKLVLMEGIKTAYCPGFAQMISIAKSGAIGKIRDVEACFSRITPPDLREMVDAKYGGAFLEFGSYTLLPILKLLGREYEKVQFESILGENGVDLYTKIHFRYPEGLALSKTGIGVKSEGQLVIAGTKGYILAESPWWLTQSFEVRYEDPNKREKFSCKFLGDGLRYEISDFVSRIHGNGERSFKLTSEESIAMADIVERFMDHRREEEVKLKFKNRKTGLKIWSHRGCSYHYPENTLPAFEKACGLDGITGIELDIQLSKDGEIVVIHDETLERTTDGTGYVKDCSLKELKQSKIRMPLSGGMFPHTTIPTIDEVFKLLKPYCTRNGLLINIELKNSNIRYEGMEKIILDKVQAQGLDKYVIYSSFNKESLRQLKEMNSSVSIGMLSYSMKEAIEAGSGMAADAYHPNIDGIDLEKDSITRNKPIRVWNRKEPLFGEGKPQIVFNLTLLKEKGITDIMTNMPENYLGD